MELKPLFRDIADAIREKDGTTDTIKAADFPERILAIQGGGGGIELESISIITPPETTKYQVGEFFDPTGLRIRAAYTNGATRDVADYTVTPSASTPLTGNDTKVIIQLTECGITKTVEQAILVVTREYLYGFDIELSNNNPATRVSYPADVDNAGFTAAKMNFGGSFSYGSWPSTPGSKFMPRPCMLRYNGTVGYYLNPNDYTKKADGSASDVANINYGGNAMMEWPEIYVRRWESGGVYHFRCSDVKVDSDYECWSNYDKNNKRIPHFYTPIYCGSKDSANRLRSISGQSNMVSQTAQNEVTYAKANGADIWYTEVAADHFLLQDLLVMMFKSTNLQAIAGQGVCAASAAIAPGTMNAKGMFWGASGKTSGVKAFGMENPWGNIFRRIAGWVLVSKEHKVKLTRGTKDGTTVSDYNTDGTGYLSTGATITANGYISGMKTEKYGRVPIAASGSDTAYEADYVYQGSEIGYALVGGAWDVNQGCGPFYISLCYTASLPSSYIGASVSCKPLAAV